MPNHTIFDERPESQDRAIKLIEKLGYQYIPRVQAETMRSKLSNVLFTTVLREFLSRQSFYYRGKMTPFSERSIGAAIRDIDVPLVSGLMTASKNIYDLLLTGNSYEEELFDGGRQSFDLQFIDWNCPENNIWQVTEEFSVERPNGKFARPDIVILINGIPIVVIECKKSSIDVEEGIRQNIRNWQPDYIPQLFKFVQIVMALNPNKVKYGTCGTTEEFFCSWREKEYKWQEEVCRRYSEDSQITEQDKSIVSLLSKSRLADIIRYFILYDNNIKKIARYQQFFGIDAAIKRIKGEDDKNTRSGVIWHTQGSGKSLTMVMLVKKILADPKIKNPRFVLVNDRINLDKQLRDNFIKTKMNPSRAKTGKGLISLLENPAETIITTVIHKFETAARVRTKITDENIFLFVDESHRSHSGLFHNLMNEVLPDAIKIAFTGTPLLKTEKFNTYHQFGPLIGDAYTFENGIEDNIIVPLVYEGRIIPQDVKNDKIDDYLKYIIAPLNEQQKEDMKRKWSHFMPLAQTRQRIDMIAFDIHEHFLSYCKPQGFKAIIAASSRPAAIDVHYSLKKIGGVKSAVVICPESVNEGDDLTNENRQKIQNFFKVEVEPKFGLDYEKYEDWAKDNLIGGEDVDIVIVKDMLLTGFDAPPVAVLYVDKPMKDHTLLQAIARVNRIHPGKDFGLIVDYWGLFEKLNAAIDMYKDAKSGMNGYDSEDIKNALLGAFDQKVNLEQANKNLWRIFDDVEFDRNSSEAWQKQLEDDKKRKDFYEKLSIFSRLLELVIGSHSLFEAIGYEQIMKYKQDFLHFQKLRGAVILRYNEAVDFSQYEDGIRSLLNNFVLSEPTQIIIVPVPIHDKIAMEKQLEQIDGKVAKADAIRTRIATELDTQVYEDPMFYKKFSEMIKETIETYKVQRNDDSYLADMTRLAHDFRQGFVGYQYPACIDRNSDAKAFYGIINEVLKNYVNDLSDKIDEDIGRLALDITTAISNFAKVDWRYNASVHKKMEQAIDDLIWDFTEKHSIILPIEKIDLMLENVRKTAMSRY